MNPVTASASPPAAAPELRDFSDRLPAVLVKELRQGLRTRMFVAPFLILHALLVLGSLESGLGNTSFFWHSLIILLVVLLPMRNLSALSEERQGRTLDTLLLTGITPWRIVSGKWSATFALTALTAVSALPYLLVRYLNGGSSFLAEGAALAGLVLLSGAIAAVFTAFSTIASGLMRHIFGVLTISVAYGAGGVTLLRIMQGSTAAGGSIIVSAVCLAVWASLFCLWHAAATIAPAATNLTSARRITTLVAVMVGALIQSVFAGTGDFQRHALLIILMVSSVVEMGESLSWNPAAGAAFARRGVAGRLAAVILYPGWATGVVFSVVLWGVAVVTYGYPERWKDFATPAGLCFFSATVGAMLFFRRYSGAALMILIAVMTHILAVLAIALLPQSGQTVSMIVPFLQNRDFPPVMALVWAGVALALAAGPLIMLERRISRESSL
jgi:hypothetical protein